MRSVKPSKKQWIGWLALAATAVAVGLTFRNSDELPTLPRSEYTDAASVAPPALAARKVHPIAKNSAQNEVHHVSFHEVAAKLETLNRCYSDACADAELAKLSGNDRYFATGEKITNELRQLLAVTTQKEMQDSRIVKIAVAELRNSDGFVKEAALDLLSTQATSPEIPGLIISEVIQGADAELVEQGLLELARYQNSNGKEIESGVAESLKTGSPFTAQKLADHLDIILSRQNADYFDSVAQSLIPQSRVRKTVLEQIRSINSI